MQQKEIKVLFHLDKIIVFVLLAVLSYMYAFDPEDLAHMQAHCCSEGFRYACISYQEWNARIGELVSYAIGFQNGISSYYLQYAYYLLNPVFCVAAIFLSIRIAVGTWSGCRKSFLFIFVSLCFLGSKQGWFWFIGNMNWLYPSVLAMLFFVLWEDIFKSGDFKIQTWKFLSCMPLAVVVGMSNENTSVVSLLLFTGCGLYACVKQRKICITWQYVVIEAILLISAFLFFMAPAGTARAAASGWELSFHNILFNSLLQPANWLYAAIFYWREALVLSIMVYIGWRRGVKLIDKRLAFMMLVMLLLWSVLLAAPCWGAPRAYTPLDLILFAIMARLLYKIVNHKGCGAKEVGMILSLRTVLTLTILVPTIALAVAQYRVRSQIAARAEAALARGETHLVLHKGEIDTSPVMPRYFHIPGCMVAHDLSPYIPLIGISKEKYEKTLDFTHHEWTSLTGQWYPSSGDDVLNLGVAKRFGLNSIIYVR